MNHNILNNQISISNNIKPLIISPPFGNYLHYKHTSNVYGSYTLYERKGKLQQLIKTLRYSNKHKAWFNQIGLRNSGIQKAKNPHIGNIISICALKSSDWFFLTKELLNLKAKGFTWSAVEINLSCPNEKIASISSDDLQELLKHFPLIAKLAPTKPARKQALFLYENGIRCFHLCNTLKTNKGGVSGTLLKKYSLQQIKWFKNIIKDKEVIIIGGGGISSIDDAKEYLDSGANKLSLGVCNFNPIKSYNLIRQIYKLI